MSRLHHKGGEPSQRMLRVGELIRHALSELLTRGELNEPALEGKVVTVSRVGMSPDLKCATAFVLPLGGGDGATVIEGLENRRKYLRGEVARKINLKFAPDLRFKLDDSFDNIDHIDRLLNSPRVRQDIERDADTGRDSEDDAASKPDQKSDQA